MNREEAAKLVRLVRAVAPAQKIDEHTPDVWAVVLDDIEITDALQAVKHIARRQSFISTANIVDEVKRIRAERYKHANVASTQIAPDTDSGAEQIRFQKEFQKRLAQGQIPVSLEKLFRDVPQIGGTDELQARRNKAGNEKVREELRRRRKREDLNRETA